VSARRSCRRWSRVRCRIATNKSPLFEPKALSFHFVIFRRLQQLNSIDVLDQVTLLVTCYYWLQRLYLCLLLLKREYPVMCLIFYGSQALSFSFLSLPKQRTFQLVFFFGNFYEFSRKNVNESKGSSLKRSLRIVSKWIPFDSLAYIWESWRRPDLFKRKESWSPQDVTKLCMRIE